MSLTQQKLGGGKSPHLTYIEKDITKHANYNMMKNYTLLRESDSEKCIVT